MRYLTFALAKGRLAKTAMDMFEELGITCEAMKDKDTRKQFLSPESITKLAFGGIMNKFMPGIKEGLKALDESFNESLITGLIRLGENRGTRWIGTATLRGNCVYLRHAIASRTCTRAAL